MPLLPFVNKIICGDALTELKKFPDNCVDTIITSPPYWGLRDYGTAKWEGGSSNCNHRIDRFGNRKVTEATNIDQSKQKSLAGEFVPINGICPKCGAKRIDKQIGLEPTIQEYITKLCDVFDQVKRVLKKEGTCWVNIGDAYHSSPFGRKQGGFSGKAAKNNPDYGKVLLVKKPNSGLEYKCLLQIPSRFAIEMTNRGWILRNEIIWHKPNCMPSSVKDRFTVDFEKIFFFVKNKKYWFETQYEELAKPERKNFQSGKRINRKNPNRNDNDLGYRSKDFRFEKRNKRSIWSIPLKSIKEFHFAVYPEELCETPIKAGCPKGGIVLDPFFGTGTTGVAAKKLGRNYIGIELNPRYCKIAQKRIDACTKPLF